MGSSRQEAAAAARSASDQSGLLGWGRRLGSPFPLCLLPEVARAAPVSPAVRLTRRRPCLDPARLLRAGYGTGAGRQPAIAVFRPIPAGRPATRAAVGCSRAGEGGIACPVVGAERRARSGDPRRGAAGAVRKRRRPANLAAARYGREGCRSGE